MPKQYAVGAIGLGCRVDDMLDLDKIHSACRSVDKGRPQPKAANYCRAVIQYVHRPACEEVASDCVTSSTAGRTDIDHRASGVGCHEVRETSWRSCSTLDINHGNVNFAFHGHRPRAAVQRMGTQWSIKCSSKFSHGELLGLHVIAEPAIELQISQQLAG